MTKPLKILIVEDEPIAVLVNRKLLEKLGYTPDVATNGAQAIEMAANSYDIIFMDIGLPDMDGITVASEIRHRESKNQKSACIIALTGYFLKEVRDKCLKAGMNDIAAKPITIEQLREIIIHLSPAY